MVGCLLFIVGVAMLLLGTAAAGGAMALAAILGIIILVTMLARIERAITSRSQREPDQPAQPRRPAGERPAWSLLDKDGRLDIERAALYVAVGVGAWALVTQATPIFWGAVILGLGAVVSQQITKQEQGEG